MSDEKIIKLTLDKGTIKHRTMEVEHECKVAITDLLHENVFNPHCMQNGPYHLHLSVEENRLLFDIHSPSADKHTKFPLAVQPLKRLIRDYFMICDSYYEALQHSGKGRLEAIDMGRRGLHNEGAELLQELLKGRISVDLPTARRLFTLICVLHIK